MTQLSKLNQETNQKFEDLQERTKVRFQLELYCILSMIKYEANRHTEYESEYRLALEIAERDLQWFNESLERFKVNRDGEWFLVNNKLSFDGHKLVIEGSPRGELGNSRQRKADIRNQMLKGFKIR